MQVEDDVVTSCSRTGGDRGWQLYSISRWTKQDGRRLKKYLEEEFENGNRQVYWDDVAMFLHPQDFELGIFKMQKSDVAEIDSLEELAAADDSYKKYLNAAETAQ
jgi:CTP:phosphocholine cytidylyltransferase-like protein